MKTTLPLLAFLAASCAAVSGPPQSAPWGPFGYGYDGYDWSRSEGAGGSFGMGGGYVTTMGEATPSFNPTFVAGLRYNVPKERSSIKFMEYGLDYLPAKNTDDLDPDKHELSSMFFFSYDVAFGSRSGKAGKGAYVLAGVRGLLEFHKYAVATGLGDPSVGLSIDLGVGLKGRKSDLRWYCMWAPWAGNVKAISVLGAGFYF